MNHSLNLSNLQAGTTYRYIVESTDQYGNTVKSQAGFFTTQQNPDGSPPNVNFFKPIKGVFPHSFELIAEDPAGIGKVEFYMHDTLVYNDYSGPYILALNPSENGRIWPKDSPTSTFAWFATTWRNQRRIMTKLCLELENALENIV